MNSRLSFYAASCLALASFSASAVETGNTSSPPTTNNVSPPALPALSLPGSHVSAPVSQVIKLAKSKVADEVVLSFIENSPYIFNLTPENIIYLGEQGIDSKHIQAMLLHDRQVREKSNTPLYPPPVPAQSTPPFPDSNAPPADIAQPPDSSSLEPSMEPIPADQAAADAQSAGNFFSSLAPYGNWSTVPGYGSCWQPNAACSDPNWKPYCDQGQWFFSDCGWYWHSYYPWGWAPFHYGRWCQHPQLGWLWCPGSKWAPSWVTWRDSGANIGWAPLPPGTLFADKRGLTWQGLRVANNCGFGLGPNAFTFVAAENFGSWDLGACRLNSTDSSRAFPDTRAINNFASGPDGAVLNRGLDVNLVAADSGNPIIRARLNDVSSLQNAGFCSNGSVDPGTVNVFRPRANTPGGHSLNAQPSTRESLTIPPVNFASGHPEPFSFNTSGEALAQSQQGSGQPFRFNHEFPKVILPNTGPAFAPAGTRSVNGLLRIQPQVHLQGFRAAPHAAFGTTGVGGGKRG